AGARRLGCLALRRPAHRAGARGSRCQGEAAALCRPGRVCRHRHRPAQPLPCGAAEAGGRGARSIGRRLSMATEIKVPALGESVTEATVAKWLKKLGEPIAVCAPAVEVRTGKA